MSAKGKYIVFLTIAIMTVSACSYNSESSSEKGNSTASALLSELPAFDGDLDFTYVPETDAQSELGQYPSRAYTEEGIYTLTQTDESSSVSGWFLMFYDYASGQTVYVCGKSNCTHTDDSCNAFFSISEYIPPCIWYYDAYFSPDYAEGINQLYRVKLDSDEEPELLYSMDNVEYPNLHRLKPYGKYVFFQMGSLDDNNPEELDIDLYVYDTESGEISFAAENVFRPYTVGGKYLYYTGWEDEVYQKNLETGEVTLFYEHISEDELEYVIAEVFCLEDSLVYEYSMQVNNEETGWKTFYQQFVLDESGEITDTYDTEHNNLVTPYGPKILD